MTTTRIRTLIAVTAASLALIGCASSNTQDGAQTSEPSRIQNQLTAANYTGEVDKTCDHIDALGIDALVRLYDTDPAIRDTVDALAATHDLPAGTRILTEINTWCDAR